MNAPTKPNAFTLIELLVVISIIAILISLLLPVLTQSRYEGRNALCAANLRSWGVASNAYANDFDYFLPSHNFNQVGVVPHVWDVSKQFIEQMNTYGLSRQLVECPHTGADASFDSDLWFDFFANESNLLPGYALWVPRTVNGVEEYPPASAGEYPVNLDQDNILEFPVATDLIVKGRFLYTSDALDDGAPIERSISTILAGSMEGVFAWHDVGGRVSPTNQVFADGHVARKQAQDIRTAWTSTINYRNMH